MKVRVALKLVCYTCGETIFINQIQFAYPKGILANGSWSCTYCDSLVCIIVT